MSKEICMQRALELANKAKGRTSPNPMVGAVIVKGYRIISEGYHKKAGTPHAEIVALKKAGNKAKDATMFVTLEPCCHTDKRTPPCTKAIIASGIKKVIIATNDPNPKVSGKGIKELRKAGIETEVGILRSEAKHLNESYNKFIIKKKPFVVLKIAQSLDGKIATAKGESKWITGKTARKHVHQLRNDLDAVLVGIGTVMKDDPSLDCRLRGGRDPYRIIVDSGLRIPLKSKVLGYSDNKTIIATTNKASKRKISQINTLGAKVLVIKSKSGMVNLKALMKELGKLDITGVMIEGGSSIASSAISSEIVDRVMFFVAPKIIGGTDSISSIGGKSPSLLGNAIKLKNLRAITIGDDILIEGYL
ncbi:riboflavin biosynthesis protein RibD [bacterium BMS3Bbin09]|nr:riboflavin biosynthesis protein RibD [bacterium BMS3Bbin09]